MAVQTWNRLRGRETPDTGESTHDKEPKTVVVERRPRRRLLGKRHNPVSMMLWAAGFAAALILLIGMLLTWAEANPANALVNATYNAGEWLATPFHNVFTNPDAETRLYQNWGLAAAVYYVLGRVASWLTRF